MILNTAPQNEAILSNVGQIGEFRIRNSAKAFNILSSGLYANKIKAIIRELSCNAVDSHTAAGNSDPFEVHLPTQLEPWFAIRDFGTGLNHDQVTNIYTTYFESTKTASNEFIGALGLGSKSPFSYTDNFTVTAVKDGNKRIYSAFINNEGVPSIALMMEEETADANGVEVKFGVDDYYDFRKFQQEAHSVFKWFKQQPKFTGAELTVTPIEFVDRDIIPGVHTHSDSHRSYAVMGNIAYPIEVPNAETNLGELANLLACGLVMEFGIGELDFQASREGLSYIPQTIDSIKSKLTALNAVLVEKLTAEADALTNLWERAFFLDKKDDQRLWKAAVREYVTKTDFKLFNATKGSSYLRTVNFEMREEDLAKKFNIVLKGFNKNGGSAAASNIKPSREYDYSAPLKADGSRATWLQFTIPVADHVRFVVNDTKKGALERAKHHWRESRDANGRALSNAVFVLEKADKNKPMNVKAFLKALANPPASYTMNASSLLEKTRTGADRAKNVQILKLERRDAHGGYRNRRDASDLVWRDAAKLDEFDTAKTFYYMPINGFVAVSKIGWTDVKYMVEAMKDSGLFPDMPTVYGVRKGDLEMVQSMGNWINLEDHIVNRINSVDQKIITQMALNAIDKYDQVRYNGSVVCRIESEDSPFRALALKTKDVEKIRYNKHSLEWLCNQYTPGSTVSPAAQAQAFVDECEAVYKRYPLLKCLGYRNEDPDAVAEYINLIDAKVN
jgi:hypothetical protein